METWKSLKDIVENGDYYEVSNTGKVKNSKRNKLLKVKTHKNGYCEVTLKLDGKQKTYKLHRLVALAFIPNPDNKPEVNHKDGNKSNCKEYNLEWSTRIENQKHAIDNSLLKVDGENNPMSKLTVDDVLEIRRLYGTGGYTLNDLSERFGVVFQTISAIVNYTKWKNIG